MLREELKNRIAELREIAFSVNYRDLPPYKSQESIDRLQASLKRLEQLYEDLDY